jgi:hypothetical protein
MSLMSWLRHLVGHSIVSEERQLAATDHNTEASRKNTRALRVNTVGALVGVALVASGWAAHYDAKHRESFRVVGLSVVDNAPTDVQERGNYSTSVVVNPGTSEGIDVALANNTRSLVVLTRTKISVVEVSRFEGCRAAGGGLEATSSYGLTLPTNISVGLEASVETMQEIRPRTADRFVVSIGRDTGQGGPGTLDSYLIRIMVYMEIHIGQDTQERPVGQAYIVLGIPDVAGRGDLACEQRNLGRLRSAFDQNPAVARSPSREKLVHDLAGGP